MKLRGLRWPCTAQLITRQVLNQLAFFQEGGHSRDLGFPIRIILATFDLQFTDPHDPAGSATFFHGDLL